MEQPLNDLLPLPAKIAGEIDNIPGLPDAEIGTALGVSKQAAHNLAGAAISSLREALAGMGFSGIDTQGLLKSQSKSGCGADCGVISSPRVSDSDPLAHATTHGTMMPSLMPWIFFLSAGTMVAKQPPSVVSPAESVKK